MTGDQGSEPILDGPLTMPSCESGWWETERAELIRSRVVALSEDGDRILDVGCGRGQMFDDPRLARRTRVNIDSHGWSHWAPDRGILYVRARADALPFRAGSFDLVGSFDVLEHLGDDREGLAEQRRVVREGGRVVTAVPADPRLWSVHDENVGHHRRYRAAEFGRLARSAGLECDRSSHFFSFLWAPARIFRSSSSRTAEPGNSGPLGSSIVRVVVGLLSRLERWLMRYRAIPFGTSLWFESRPTDGLSPTRPQPGPGART